MSTQVTFKQAIETTKIDPTKVWRAIIRPNGGIAWDLYAANDQKTFEELARLQAIKNWECYEEDGDPDHLNISLAYFIEEEDWEYGNGEMYFCFVSSGNGTNYDLGYDDNDGKGWDRDSYIKAVIAQALDFYRYQDPDWETPSEEISLAGDQTVHEYGLYEAYFHVN